MELTKIPVRLSTAQIRKLKMGGAIGLKPANFMMGEGHTPSHSLAVMPGNLRKIANANRKNKGMRLQLKPDEDLMMMNGGSILGDIKRALKKVGSKIEKVATSKPVKAVGRQIASTLIKDGIPIAASALGSAIGSSAATLSGNPEFAPVAGKIGAKLGSQGGKSLSKYVSRKTGYGMMVPISKSNMTPRLVGPGGIRKMTGEGYHTGMGFLPAGDKSGSGIAVVAPSAPSDIIQSGSPYANINSAAMNPFIAPSIQLCGKKMGAGFMPAGGV